MRRIVAFVLFVSVLAMASGQAEAPKRKILNRIDTPMPMQEALMVQVELDVGAATGRHSHHGVELGLIQEGEVEMRIDGESIRKLMAGDSFAIASGKVHEARNKGSTPARVIVTYVVEKDKPLAVPAK